MESSGSSGRRGGMPLSQFRAFLRENWVALELATGYEHALGEAAKRGIKPDTDISGQKAYSAERVRQSSVDGSSSVPKAKRKGAKIDLDSAPLLKELLEAFDDLGRAGQRVKAVAGQIQQQLNAKDNRIGELEEELRKVLQSGEKDRADAAIYRQMKAVEAKARGVQNSAGMVDVSRP